MPAPAAAGHSPAPRLMEAHPVYPIGEVAGPGADPVVALQDTRYGHPGGKLFRPPFDAARRRAGPSGGAEPGRPNVHVMDLDRPDYHAPGMDQISRGSAPYIIALGLGGVLQRSGKIRVHQLRRIHSVIYGTTQLDNAVQDTKR